MTPGFGLFKIYLYSHFGRSQLFKCVFVRTRRTRVFNMYIGIFSLPLTHVKVSTHSLYDE